MDRHPRYTCERSGDIRRLFSFSLKCFCFGNKILGVINAGVAPHAGHGCFLTKFCKDRTTVLRRPRAALGARSIWNWV